MRPIKPTVTIEEFDKLDVRVCKILTCVKVPDTYKLMDMEIQISETEKRRVVSGIGDQFSEEDLIGKYLPFILNLPTRKIKGIESEAMVIVAERSTGGLSIITNPDTDDLLGAIVI